MLVHLNVKCKAIKVLGDLPNPGIETLSPALLADSLPSEPPGMSFNFCLRFASRESSTVSPMDYGPAATTIFRHSYVVSFPSSPPLAPTTLE